MTLSGVFACVPPFARRQNVAPAFCDARPMLPAATAPRATLPKDLLSEVPLISRGTLSVTDAVSSRPTPAAARARGASFFARDCDPGPAGLRQADGDRLFRGLRPVFAAADVVHFLVNEFTRLGRCRFPLALVATRALHGFSLGHDPVSFFRLSGGCGIPSIRPGPNLR